MTDNTKPDSGEGIRTGDVTGNTGVTIGHRSVTTVIQTDGAQADEIAGAFAAILEQVQAMPDGAAKEDSQEAVAKLEAEARKGEEADESRVQRWFQFLAETSVDAWEVAVATFVNPIAGVGTAFSKIAARAIREREQSESQ